MSYKPDFGLRLINEGWSQDADHHFANFRLFNLGVLGGGQYSTTVDMPYQRELYAMSLDFNQEQFEQILIKANPDLATFLLEQLLRDPVTPRTIEFEGEIAFGVRARLGQLQKVAHESFVPFVAQEIM